MYRVSKVYLLPDADAVVLLGQVVVVVTGAIVEAPHVARDPGVILSTARGRGPAHSTGDLIHSDLPESVKRGPGCCD